MRAARSPSPAARTAPFPRIPTTLSAATSKVAGARNKRPSPEHETSKIGMPCEYLQPCARLARAAR
eukprot:6091440-Alexandrium_andersonii.AAC.1